VGKQIQRVLLRITLAWVAAGGLTLFASVDARGQDVSSIDAARDEFRQRLEHLSDETGACVSLSQWALDQGLFAEADELIRRFLVRHPTDDEAHQLLDSMWSERGICADSEPYRKTRALLPERFTEHETARFIVLSDCNLAWTRERAEHFERTFHQFQRFASRLNLRPLPIRHKLVCVLFRSREDYHTFANLHDDVTDPAVAGYYSPKADRIVFYSPQANPSVGRANDQIEGMRRDLESLRARLEEAERLDPDEARSLRTTVRSREMHLTREEEKVILFIDQTSIATTIHEAIHQLMFHTHVQTPYVQYPVWICEGLATAFETDRPNQAFGPDLEFPLRRKRFELLLKDDRLLSLEALIQMTSLPMRGDDTADIVYHQSYALVSWLARFRKAELAEYLLLMRERKQGRPSAKEHLQIFECAFGDVARVERSWLRYEIGRVSVASGESGAAGLGINSETARIGRVTTVSAALLVCE